MKYTDKKKNTPHDKAALEQTLRSLKDYQKDREKKGPSRRSQRLTSILHEDMSFLLPQVLERHGFSLGDCSLSRVQVSDNGHHCCLLIHGPSSEEKVKIIKNILPLLRQEFCKIAHMRFTPTFAVTVDKKAAYEEKIEVLLKNLDKEGWEEKEDNVGSA